jgi:hypothetical protein
VRRHTQAVLPRRRTLPSRCKLLAWRRQQQSRPHRRDLRRLSRPRRRIWQASRRKALQQLLCMTRPGRCRCHNCGRTLQLLTGINAAPARHMLAHPSRRRARQQDSLSPAVRLQTVTRPMQAMGRSQGLRGGCQRCHCSRRELQTGAMLRMHQCESQWLLAQMPAPQTAGWAASGKDVDIREGRAMLCWTVARLRMQLPCQRRLAPPARMQAVQ